MPADALLAPASVSGSLISAIVAISVAAFGGGLLGSVLTPLVEHALQQRRTKGEIERRRQQQLRRMLQTELQTVRDMLQLGMKMIFAKRRGDVVEASLVEEAFAPRPKFLWQPARIPDVTLRALADELAQLDHEVGEKLIVPSGDEGLPIDEDRWRACADRLHELQEKIVAEMDGLYWPELDE